MANTATITRQLRAEGLPIELVRGDGYHYFIFDDGARYESRSVWVPRFSDLSAETWLAEGREFAAEAAAKPAPAYKGGILRLSGGGI